MKYAFFGTAGFSAIVLNRLIEAGFKPALVVCNPDKPVGRKKTITPPPVKLIALKNGLKVWQPVKPDIDGWRKEAGEVDFALDVAYARIIPQGIVEAPRLGVIGVHPSILPQFRGPSPIQSVILAGKSKTGTTLFLLDDQMDHGAVIARAELEEDISRINYPELSDKLARLSAGLLIKDLPDYLAGKTIPRVQDESLVSITHKFKTEDGFVSSETLEAALNGQSETDAREIDRKIRALNPEPGIYTIRDGKRIKLIKAEIKDGKLKLLEIQKEGKKSTRLS